MLGLVKVFILVAFVTPAGKPIVSPFVEDNVFVTIAECEEWGVKMAPRIEDYTRGAAHLEWADPVKVLIECRVQGEPA